MRAEADRRSAHYLLGALALFYTSSFVDRAILNILAQPIKEDFGLTDWQLGILGGLAFAMLYAGLGVPIARLAERYNRMTIISVALTLWSLMTMACAAATSFVQLAVARAGVGIGEAACTPCAHSLIGDSFPAHRRATALSIYSLGIPLGTLAGTLGGAWVAERFGWRVAFLAVGAPGLLLALVAKLTIKEPIRGRFDPPAPAQPPALTEVLHHLLARPTFIHLVVGVSLATLVSAGIMTFTAPFLLRASFDLGLKQAALVMAGLSGVFALIGTCLGGVLCDRLGRQDVRLYLRVPAVAFLLAAPLYSVAFLQDELSTFFALAALAQVFALIYLGPTFSVLQNMVATRMRATAIAIVFVLTSVIGLGLGPMLVGGLSDLAAAAIAGADVWPQCPGSASDRCQAASFEGLRAALIFSALVYFWACAHYYMASRTLSRDLIARPSV
jgi:MFS family permease